MKLKNITLQPTALLAELVGTFVLASVAIAIGQPLIVGFTLVVLVVAVGAVSGAHLNPAVSFGLFSRRKLDAATMVAYWVMQFAGAFAALLVMQAFKGADFGISFASFNNFDAKLVVAELIGAAVFTFAIAAATERKIDEAAKAITIGFALMVGLYVGGGLIAQAAQSASLSATKGATPRVSAVDGAVLNPAIALAATEKDQATVSLQSLTGAAPEAKKPASRLTWETLVGALVGGAVGMNLYALTTGENPFAKKKTPAQAVATKVTKVVKKAKAKAKK